MERCPINPWQGKTIAQMLDESAARWPDREAVVDGGTRLTYAELRERRDALVRGLRGAGIEDGSRVATYLGESWEHVALLYALFALGAVVVPLNLTWEVAELRDALDRCDADVLVAGMAHNGRDLFPKLAELGLREPGPVEVDAVPRLRAVIVHDREAAPSPWQLQALFAGGRSDPVPSSARQESLLLFTSGSSARPKGVVLRQDGLLGSAHFFIGRLTLNHQDRYLNLSPYYHAGGIVTALLACHVSGASHYLFEGFQPTAMAKVATEESCTATGGFDIVMLRLLREFEQLGVDPPFRKIATGPGNLVHDLLEDAGVIPLMMYGMSEAGNLVTITDPVNESERGRMSHGYPMPGVELKVCDPESGERVGPGIRGELCFRGWNLFQGYYNMPEETAAAFDEEGYFHTGDYGWLDEEGRLYYRGRYSMMVKTGGENVSELEVENFLVAEIPGIRAAQVVGAPDDRWGELVVAFVEVEDPASFDGDQLRDACRGRIARYKIPRRFILVEAGEWPVTGLGKVRKQDLRERAAREFGSGAAPQAPAAHA